MTKTIINMHDRVSVYEPSCMPDDFGGYISGWNIIGDVWGKIETVSSNEFYKYHFVKNNILAFPQHKRMFVIMFKTGIMIPRYSKIKYKNIFIKLVSDNISNDKKYIKFLACED